MVLLGVNIDHVATLRQQRREMDPDPVKAALVCQEAGADSIVAHLREDRRHICDRDIRRLKDSLHVRFNLELSLNPDIIRIACDIRPDQVTLVPEKRQELTTEGGLDVVKYKKKLQAACGRLSEKGIQISLFVDPDREQLDAVKELGIGVIELHTGRYAAGTTAQARKAELKTLTRMTAYAEKLGLIVNAGHGLKYHNTKFVADISGMHELNIGHSIISQAIFVGLSQAVKEMVSVIRSSA